ncbi:DUF2894 domain-containing protein [Schauerella aestuarii]|uniref:DUF2894 domain-containing protein n=1 Tax=Schauerella aestuarii TaxID=2511204 RepID=UPI00136EF219|nr:DUF2894 domain-containing protein [Achromobacter aestuarii]MYZ42666.1 DUF2894 domain-containing protein [Achromobacter aestuarii]
MTGDATTDLHATLHAWRASGHDRLNPARFQFIAALARRAESHRGLARQVLDRKLADALAAYAAHIERTSEAAEPASATAQPSAKDVASVDARADRGAGRDREASEHPAGPVNRVADTTAVVPAGRPLEALAAHLAMQHAADGDSAVLQTLAQQRAAYPELPAIDYFREAWASVSTNKQLRQSQAHVPDNAGPLNSSHLVHRSLSLMRTLSPGYVRQFLSYVDALSWMDQLNQAGTTPAKDAPRTAAGKKSAARKKS